MPSRSDVGADGEQQSFTWLKEHGRANSRLADILHVSVGGLHYVVYVADEASEELGLEECKAIAERKIRLSPTVREVVIISRQG